MVILFATIYWVPIRNKVSVSESSHEDKRNAENFIKKPKITFHEMFEKAKKCP